jgi:tetratricopeptide (TPR) repeat protein
VTPPRPPLPSPSPTGSDPMQAHASSRAAGAAPAGGRRRRLVIAGAVAAWLAGWCLATGARADEIVYRDPETCGDVTVHAEEITAETWTEVTYTERARGPALTVPTPLVVEIRRSTDDPQAKRLRSAVRELQRGNAAEAARVFKTLSGGGYSVNLETGARQYTPFTQNDPPGRGKRPEWIREYAHFYYAKALVEQGESSGDHAVLEEALLALDDGVVPGVDGNVHSGGFLKRFEGGNSRWLPEAMLLKARALGDLGRTDEARKAYDDLKAKAIGIAIGPRWAFEALLGPGRLAEQGGNALDAVTQYGRAADLMIQLLRDETQPCYRRELGRLYSEARMHAAGVMLEQAEKNKSPAEFATLRAYIQAGTPEALRHDPKVTVLPKSQQDAIVAGAMDPAVQAVAQNGLGLAYLQEKQYGAAILAFRSVEVTAFEVPEQHARALHYLAVAAGEAAKTAQGDAKAYYEGIRDASVQRLKAEHPDSPWSR